MPWCQNCKNEYRDGIKVCADCNSVLVEKLAEEPMPEELSEPEITELDSWQPDEELEQQSQSQQETGVYQASSQKAEDFKSSAYTLLLVGAVGLVLLILYYFDIIHLPFSGMNKYLLSGVMGALFILFLVMGVLSFKSSKTYATKAKSEENLTREILGWCRDKLTREFIDEGLFMEEIPEEQKYFKRSEKMRNLVTEKYLNLEEGYVEHLIDDFYQEVFGS